MDVLATSRVDRAPVGLLRKVKAYVALTKPRVME
ncbi:MAG: protoheme IX farnesyltransferase, partial [Actinomycetota bacterium]|nr:protoheme IX farnesyltransferase [Actinomycetota bacterium]